WLVKSLRMESASQNLQLVRQPIYPAGRSGWHSNGSVAQPHENSYDFWTSADLPTIEEQQDPRLQKKPPHNLQVQLTPARHAAYQFLFEKLPRPATGLIVPVEKTMKDDSGAELTV